MRVWTPAFQHQFLDGNLLNFNAAPGAEPIVSFEAPHVRPAPLPQDRGFPVRRGNRFTYEFEPDAFARVIGVDITLDTVIPPGSANAQLLGQVVLGNDTVRVAIGFSDGNARLQLRVLDNSNVIAAIAQFDPAAPLTIRARWHTHGQGHVWVNGGLRSYHPALASGQSFPIDRIAFGHHDTSGFAPGAPAFLIRRVTVRLLRDTDAVRFVDGLFPVGEPPAIGDECLRKLNAVEADAVTALRQYMAQAAGRLTRAWEAPQPGGPFTTEGVAAHEAALAAGKAFVAFLLGRPGGEAALVEQRIGEFLALLETSDPAGYAQAVTHLEQVSARHDPACLARLHAAAQQHAATLQPIADLLQKVWAKMRDPGGLHG